VILTVLFAIPIPILAAFVPLQEIAELVNIGTLFAFFIVNVAVIWLRRSEPEMERGFRVPLVPVVPIIGALLCAYFDDEGAGQHLVALRDLAADRDGDLRVVRLPQLAPAQERRRRGARADEHSTASRASAPGQAAVGQPRRYGETGWLLRAPASARRSGVLTCGRSS